MTDNKTRPLVLLVDDSKTYQGIFTKLLTDAGCEVICCGLGKDALELAGASKFNFVCSAFHLQDMEGIALCKSMPKTNDHKHVPFVLMTSEPVKNLVSLALHAGVTDVFHKNDIEELLVFIKRFLSLEEPMNGRVLYIEDGLSQRGFYTKIMQNAGLVVDDFESAEAAWESFLQNEYDVVLTDIVLVGEMSGIRLVSQIRRQPGSKGEVTIFALSAFDDFSRRIELFAMGVDDYIIKPVAKEELLARLRGVLRRRDRLLR